MRWGRTILAWVTVPLAAVTAVLAVAASPAAAADVSPATAPPGGAVTVTGQILDLCPAGTTVLVAVTIGGAAAGSGTFPVDGMGNVDYSVAATVPAGTPPGAVEGLAEAKACGGHTSPFRLTVSAPPSPSPSTRPTPRPTPPTVPPTAPPTGGDPAPGGDPTAPGTPPTGSAPGASADPTASPSPSGSASPGGPATPDGGSTSTPAGAELVLDKPSIRPGDGLTAHGAGCAPGDNVTLTSDGKAVGTAIADASGSFVSTLRIDRIVPGRLTVTAQCSIALTGQVDLVVSSSTGSNTSTMIIMIFFVLAGSGVLRWQLRSARPSLVRPGLAGRP